MPIKRYENMVHICNLIYSAIKRQYFPGNRHICPKETLASRFYLCILEGKSVCGCQVTRNGSMKGVNRGFTLKEEVDTETEDM